MAGLRICNLYCGLGGNRWLWPNSHKISAVEIDPMIAKAYKKRFPNDKVIIADAHRYLIKHFNEFDFIWSSPPCPSHSRARFFARKNSNPCYPDLRLYEEILFFKHHCDGKFQWVVENVIPYYSPLVSPNAKIGRHFFWSNFYIPFLMKWRSKGMNVNEFSNGKEITKKMGIKIDSTESFHVSKLQLLRNLVDPDIGLHIFTSSQKIGLFDRE